MNFESDEVRINMKYKFDGVRINSKYNEVSLNFGSDGFRINLDLVSIRSTVRSIRTSDSIGFASTFV